jgi:predicted transcriptional regulator
MSYSNNSALRDATEKATLSYYDELEKKTLILIERLENKEKNNVTAELVKRELGINYKVLGKIFSSLSEDGAIEFIVSSDKAENYSPSDMYIRTTEIGKLLTRHAIESFTRRAGIL